MIHESVYNYMNPGDGPVKLNHFPKLTEADLTTANDLFHHYIFFKTEKKSKTLWTSCCQKVGVEFPLIQRTEDEAHREIAYGVHNDQVTCPFCGRKATLKNIGKIGKGKRLEQYVPVVFLKAGNDGELYAEAFWLWKRYRFSDALDALRKLDDEDPVMLRPMYKDTRCYVFRQGQAVMYEREYDYTPGWIEVSEQLYPPRGRRKVSEPLQEGSGMWSKNAAYHVIGLEVIQKSSFKYCQYEAYRIWEKARYQMPHIERTSITHRYLIRYLAAACLYPRAMEMLFKGGLAHYIEDLIDNKRKNHDCLRWTESDPRKAFGLSALELKEYLAGNRGIKNLRYYKKFKQAGLPASFSEVDELIKQLEIDKFFDQCIRFRLKPQKLLKYVKRFEGPRCHGAGYMSTWGVLKIWMDYTDTAVRLNYDMTVERVLLPEYLEVAHDNAVEENHRREYEEETEEVKRNLETMVKRYAFELGDYIIRPAMTGSEIVEEGKALAHCVGGYAARHMKGKLTICFLRLKESPLKPLVTIELNNEGIMQQAHGFKNDSRTTPAVKEYDHILTPWLKWISEGSKRDEEGKPILDKPARARKKKEDHAA